MLVVEEMNFSKAAQKAFLTQQCVSEHIKKLEAYYGVSFFNRRPKLTLTPAGETMYRAMLQIRSMRSSLEQNMQEIVQGAVGNIRVGLNASRARTLMPTLFKKYHKQYPKVAISIVSEDTTAMVEMLMNSKLDVVIGVDTASNPLHKVIPLMDDDVYFIISNGLLKQAITDGDEYNRFKTSFMSGVDLSLFQDIPFVRNYPTSTVYSLIEKHINRYGINLKTIFSVSDYDTQFQLCASHQAAGFIPSLICRNILNYNRRVHEADYINIFPIKNLNDSLRIDCITLGYSFTPRYLEDFIRYLETEVKAEAKWLKQHINMI